MTKTVLILGANSGIAKATSQLLAQQGYNLYLAGRDQTRLQAFATELQAQYPQQKIHLGLFDATQYDQHPNFLQRVLTQTHTLTGVLLCFGYLGNHSLAIQNMNESFDIIHQNFTGAVSILNQVCQYFMTNKSTQKRFIIGVSSVSGDRGRKQNYIYSAAKSAVNIYLQGLRQQLYKANVRVVTIKPGYVDTPMTQGLTSPLMVSPQYVAKRIVASIQQRRHVYYIPGFWRILCGLLKLIPDTLYRVLP